MSRYNTAKMELRFSVYSQIEDKTSYSKFVSLEYQKWQKLEFIIPDNIYSFYDCINIEAIMTEDSYYNNGYDGIDLYFDDFRISGNPQYTVDFSRIGNIVYNDGHYTMMRNFNVCYGDVYQRKDYVRFYSGYPCTVTQNNNYQKIAEDKQFALALTGTEVYNCTFCCEMSAFPDESETGLYEKNASFIVFSANGAVDYYVAGFYDGKIAILKSDSVGGFTELVSKAYNYNYTKHYCFIVMFNECDIEFCVIEIDSNGEFIDNTCEKISYSANTQLLKGCIGFTGISGGITVYKYGII